MQTYSQYRHEYLSSLRYHNFSDHCTTPIQPEKNNVDGLKFDDPKSRRFEAIKKLSITHLRSKICMERTRLYILSCQKNVRESLLRWRSVSVPAMFSAVSDDGRSGPVGTAAISFAKIALEGVTLSIRTLRTKTDIQEPDSVEGCRTRTVNQTRGAVYLIFICFSGSVVR